MPSASANLADVVEKIKPSVVGIGTYTPSGRPQNILSGTGFAILNGQYVVTNHHVIPDELNDELLQEIVVFVGTGRSPEIRKASVVAYSDYHDLAILKIEGRPVPTMALADSRYLREGQDIAFTGYPIGAVLGLYPVSHRGIISAVTPVVIPVDDSRNLTITMLKRLKNPYMVYQLDATAYPGNSGSAVFDAITGEVVAIINKVFIKETKETIIEKPSGITYAIPVKHLHDLIEQAQLK